MGSFESDHQSASPASRTSAVPMVAASTVRGWCSQPIRASNQLSQTGVFSNSSTTATTTLQANAAGTGTTTFNLGQQPVRRALRRSTTCPGGDGESIYQYTNLRAPVKRNVATAAFMYDAHRRHAHEHRPLLRQGGDGQPHAGADGERSLRSRRRTRFLTPSLAAAQEQYAVFPAGPAFLNKDWTSQVDSHSLDDHEVKRARCRPRRQIRRVVVGVGRLLPVRQHRSRAARGR